MNRFGFAFLAALLCLAGAAQVDGRVPFGRQVLERAVQRSPAISPAKLNKIGDILDAVPQRAWARMDYDAQREFASALVRAAPEMSETQLQRGAEIVERLMGGPRRPLFSESEELAAETRAIPLGHDFPNLHIRSPGMDYDAFLSAFARHRFASELGGRFDVADLDVVTLGLSDNLRRSNEVAWEFSQRLPPGMREQARALRGLSRVQSEVERRRLLEPFQGRTIVLVGHVPPNRPAFFEFDAAGAAHAVDIAAWIESARSVGVNLVPIGCDSALIASTGVQGSIDIGTVLRGLDRVIEGRPTTLGAFFHYLTDDQLRLVFNPVETQLFGGGIAIERRSDGRPLGRILWKGYAPIWSDFDRARDEVYSCREGPGNRGAACPTAASAQPAPPEPPIDPVQPPPDDRSDPDDWNAMIAAAAGAAVGLSGLFVWRRRRRKAAASAGVE